MPEQTKTGQMALCCGAVLHCPAHCRMPGSNPGLHSLDAMASLPSCDNQKHLQHFLMSVLGTLLLLL